MYGTSDHQLGDMRVGLQPTFFCLLLPTRFGGFAVDLFR